MKIDWVATLTLLRFCFVFNKSAGDLNEDGLHTGAFMPSGYFMYVNDLTTTYDSEFSIPRLGFEELSRCFSEKGKRREDEE